MASTAQGASAPRFTPGPWAVGTHRSITSPSGTICETHSHMGIEEANANEYLIAAAPELLAALQSFVAAYNGLYPYSLAYKHACDAIAKAEWGAA